MVALAPFVEAYTPRIGFPVLKWDSDTPGTAHSVSPFIGMTFFLSYADVPVVQGDWDRNCLQ